MTTVTARVRSALALMRQGICTVYVKEEKTDERTKRTVFDETALHTDISCHLSVENASAAGETGQAAVVSQTVTLFLEPEIEIPAGSRIVVTQHGRTTEYEQSGVSVMYAGHQEIPLKIWGHT